MDAETLGVVQNGGSVRVIRDVPVSLSVTARRGADMLGSRTLLRPGDRERTGGLRRDVPGA